MFCRYAQHAVAELVVLEAWRTRIGSVLPRRQGRRRRRRGGGCGLGRGRRVCGGTGRRSVCAALVRLRDGVTERAEEHVDLEPPRTCPFAELRLRCMGDALQQVRALEQHVDLRVAKRDCATLRRDKTVLHRVCDFGADAKPDHARGAFQRMNGAHARLEM